MRQKTQTDRARPTLCHAAVERPGGGSGASGVHAKGGATTERETGRLAPRSSAHNFSGRGGSKDVGAAFETHALVFLQRQRLRLVARNVSCRGGEVDLVMRERNGTMAARPRALAGRSDKGWCAPRGIIWPHA